MATVTFSGTGILAGTHDPDEIDRRIEEDRRKASAAAELAAEREATLDQIEKAITVYVADELHAEFAERKQSEDKKKRAHLGSFLQVQRILRQVFPSLAAPARRASGYRSLSDFRDGERGRGILIASAPQ